jgi:methoxymalonate biosynthesis acyl carrier protein
VTGDADAIRGFIGRFVRGHDLRDDEDVFATGFVNSLFAMQLVTFVEKTFGLQVESEDLEIDNFRTVNAIVALIARKRAVV